MKLLRWSLLLAPMLVLAGSVVVLAAASFSVTAGPTYVAGVGYNWTVNVTAMSGDDHVICITYSTTAGAGGTLYCTPPGGGLIGNWTCQIPMQPNTTVNWQINSHSGNLTNCAEVKTTGESGSFPTGPLAITLSHLDARGTPALVPLVAAVTALGVAGAAVVVYGRRKA